ncbi:hypothetical protein [Nocardia fluminea]|uniref:hypothetical protein n=1 Tax=Nocardia fluminea TaxID=134984 RepID=UPI003439823A
MEAGRDLGDIRPAGLQVGRGDDAADVTAAQLRTVVGNLIAAGRWRSDDPDIWTVGDAGTTGPVGVPAVGSAGAGARQDTLGPVLRRPAPPWLPGTTGRPPRHGGELPFGDQSTWGEPATETFTETRFYGPAHARSWDRLHPRLTHHSSRIAAARENTGDRGHRDPPRCRPPALGGGPGCCWPPTPN